MSSRSIGAVGLSCGRLGSSSSPASAVVLGRRQLASSPRTSEQASETTPPKPARTETVRILAEAERSRIQRIGDEARSKQAVRQLLTTEKGREHLDGMSFDVSVYWNPKPWYRDTISFTAFMKRTQMWWTTWHSTMTEVQRIALGRSEDELSTFVWTPQEFLRRRKAKRIAAAELEQTFHKFRLQQVRATDLKQIAAIAAGPAKTALEKKARDPTRKSSWASAEWTAGNQHRSPKLITLLANDMVPGSGLKIRHGLVRFDFDEAITFSGKTHNQRLQRTILFEQRMFGKDTDWKVKDVNISKEKWDVEVHHQAAKA